MGNRGFAAFRKAALAAAFLAMSLGSAACIERAPTPASRRAAFDRSGLKKVLLDKVPEGVSPSGAVFGEAVELAGYEISPASPRPGDKVSVTFYWKVAKAPELNFKVFVHADTVGGEGRVGADHWPARKAYTTDLWQPGEIVKDRFAFVVPGGFDGEGIDLWAGFYLPKSQDVRLPLSNPGNGRSDGKNRLKVTRIPVSR